MESHSSLPCCKANYLYILSAILIQFVEKRSGWRSAPPSGMKTTGLLPNRCGFEKVWFPMKPTEDVPSRRRGTAEQGIAEEESLEKCMEENSKEFVEKGAEVYAKA